MIAKYILTIFNIPLFFIFIRTFISTEVEGINRKLDELRDFLEDFS